MFTPTWSFQCDKTAHHCTSPDTMNHTARAGRWTLLLQLMLWVNSKFDADCLSCWLKLLSVCPLQVIPYSFLLSPFLSRFDPWTRNTTYTQSIDYWNSLVAIDVYRPQLCCSTGVAEKRSGKACHKYQTSKQRI